MNLQQFFLKIYLDELCYDGAMGEFVGVEGRRPAGETGFVLDQLVELVRFQEIGGPSEVLRLDAWEVVEVFPDVAVVAFVQVDLVLEPDDEIVEIARLDIDPVHFDGALRDGVVGEGEAMGLQRTLEAVGVLWGALQGTEFHHGLVVEAGLLAVEKFVGKASKERLAFININRCFNVVESGEHSVHIAINHGIRQVESDGCNGGGGVFSYAFQLFKFLEIRWKLSIVFLDDLLRAVVQVTGAGVIAEALPHLQHLLLGRLGQVGHSRPAVDETQVIVSPLVDTRLLQDYL